jgi:hypothetical protein
VEHLLAVDEYAPGADVDVPELAVPHREVGVWNHPFRNSW